jgi:hypothetical protein
MDGDPKSFSESIAAMLRYARANGRRVVVQLVGSSSWQDLNTTATVRDGYIHINDADGSTSLLSLSAIAMVRLKQP